MVFTTLAKLFQTLQHPGLAKTLTNFQRLFKPFSDRIKTVHVFSRLAIYTFEVDSSSLVHSSWNLFSWVFMSRWFFKDLSKAFKTLSNLVIALSRLIKVCTLRVVQRHPRLPDLFNTLWNASTLGGSDALDLFKTTQNFFKILNYSFWIFQYQCRISMKNIWINL